MAKVARAGWRPSKEPAPVSTARKAGRIRQAEAPVGARELLLVEGGGCHTRGLKTAKAKALVVFDLPRAEFAAAMNPQQFASVKFRLASDLKEDASPRKVSKADQEMLARFIAAELQ